MDEIRGPRTADETALVSRVADEAHADGGRRFFDSLTAHERALAAPILASLSRGDASSWRRLWEIDYVRKPPTPEEFLDDPYYLGGRGAKIYPVWRRDLLYVLNPANEVSEWCLGGSQGCGKTSNAETSMLYKLACLGCLRDPAGFYGLQPGTTITFQLFSLSKLKALTAFNFQNILDRSTFFLDNFPTLRRAVRIGDQDMSTRKVRMPAGIHIEYGATLQHALSMTVIGGLLDEANFRGKKTVDEAEDINSAMSLYKEGTRRIANRFMKGGRNPGLFCLISSKRTTADFLERHIKEVMANEQLAPHVYVSDYMLWDAKPNDFGRDRVFVTVGGARAGSAVVDRTSDDDVKYRPLLERARAEGVPERRYLPSDVVPVPADLEGFFRQDCEGSLQSFAGISTSPMGKLFDPAAVKRGVDADRQHPFPSETVYAGTKSPPGYLSSLFALDQVTSHDGLSRRPRWYPAATRFVHVDLAKGRRDSVGIAMGCVARTAEVQTYEGGQSKLVPKPVVFVDFVLRLRAPKDDECDFSAIREFLLWLRDGASYPLGMVTFDSWQCLARGTRVSTQRGLVPIEEVAAGDEVMSRAGVRPIEKVFQFKSRPTLKITTRDGEVLEGTDNHKIEALDLWRYPYKTNQSGRGAGQLKRPTWAWKSLRDIQVGDVVRMVVFPLVPFKNQRDACLSRIVGLMPYKLTPKKVEWIRAQKAKGATGTWIAKRLGVSGSNVSAVLRGKTWAYPARRTRRDGLSGWMAPRRMTPALSEWLGLVWGDGHIGKEAITLTVTTAESADAVAVFRRALGFSPKYEPRPGKTYGCVRVNSRRLIRWMKDNGLNKPLVPEAVLRSSCRTQAAFLRGLFAADGAVSRRDGGVDLTTKHLALAQQVQLILRAGFGFESRIVDCGWKCYSPKYPKLFRIYCLSVRGSRRDFLSKIGFSYSTKKSRLRAHVGRPGRSIYSRIASIEQSQSDVFDIQVAGDPSYTANGFISHNSTDSMQVLQKAGIRTAPVSVDRNDAAYLLFRETVAENRFRCYDYPPLFDEMRQLEWDAFNRSVDHPVTDENGYAGKKDVSDGAAGLVWNCTRAMTDLAVKGKVSGPRTGAGAPVQYAPQPAGGSPMPNSADGWVIGGKAEPWAPEITSIGSGGRPRG